MVGVEGDGGPPEAWTRYHRALEWIRMRSFIIVHFSTFVVLSLLVGMFISLIDGLSYVDGLFEAASSISETGKPSNIFSAVLNP